MGDPSHNLDALLKAYARKRREEGGDPPPLHSAVRHQLQEEVRRTYAAPARARRPWYARFLLRPAVAGGLALAMVALGIFVTLWPWAWPPVDGASLAEPSPSVPPSAKQEALARTPAPKYDPAPSIGSSPKSTATGGAVAPSPAETGAVRRDQARGLGREDEAPAPRPAKEESVEARRGGGTTPAPRAAAKDGLLLDPPSFPSVAAAPAAMPPPAPPSAPAAQPEPVFANATLQNTRFLNQASPPARPAGGPALLRSFRVTRVGNEVVLVDADGSIYRGAVDGAEPADADKTPELNAKPKRDALGAQAESKAADARAFSFRVTGTNATLRQVVEIAGSYSPGGPEGMKSRAVPGGAGRSNQAADYLDYQDNRARAQQLQNAPAPMGRVQGRARLPDRSEVEVDAVAAPSP